MKRKFWLIAAAAMICSVMFAVGVSAATEGYYTYTVTDGKATITAVDKAISGDVTIPSALGGYPVTVIGEEVFFYHTNLTGVTIPFGVTSIGDFAFYGCKKLTSIILPNSITYIGDWVFEDCSNLTTIIIPDSVTHIGMRTFTRCTGLTSITIPSSLATIGNPSFLNCTNLTDIFVDSNNSHFASNDGILFNKTNSELICYPAGKSAVSYTLSNSVTSVETSAFSSCANLTNITIPDSVSSIGDSAFRGCTNLTSITFLGSVTSIGYMAFNACPNLTIYGYTGSTAETYATANSIPFVALPNPLYTIRGSITSFGTGDISITLLQDSKPVEGITITVDSAAGTYSITNIPAGTYTLRVSKAKHVPRDYTVTLGTP